MTLLLTTIIHSKLAVGALNRIRTKFIVGVEGWISLEELESGSHRFAVGPLNPTARVASIIALTEFLILYTNCLHVLLMLKIVLLQIQQPSIFKKTTKIILNRLGLNLI